MYMTAGPGITSRIRVAAEKLSNVFKAMGRHY